MRGKMQVCQNSLRFRTFFHGNNLTNYLTAVGNYFENNPMWNHLAMIFIAKFAWMSCPMPTCIALDAKNCLIWILIYVTVVGNGIFTKILLQ